MARELQTTRWPEASTTINVHDPIELEFWARRFRVSREMLKRAVGAAGHRYCQVDAYLRQRRAAHSPASPR